MGVEVKGGEERRDEVKQKEKRGETYRRERRWRRTPAMVGRRREGGTERGGRRRECEKEREKGESEGKKWGTVVRWETKTRRAHGRAITHGRPCAVHCARLVRTVGRTGMHSNRATLLPSTLIPGCPSD